MRNRILVLAVVTLLPFATAPLVSAAEPPADSGMASEPEDPNAAPYPPDGVIDPNVDYPTDGVEGTDQGEAGATDQPAPPAAAPAPPAAGATPPAAGAATPPTADSKKAP
jgi:hypothetical protein